MLSDSVMYVVIDHIATGHPYQTIWDTVQYKILEGENLCEFGELQVIRQNFSWPKFSLLIS